MNANNTEKSYSYQLFFNYFRPKMNKRNKSPAEILKEKGLKKEVETGLSNFLPIRLEWLIREMNKPEKSVYHLPWQPRKILKEAGSFS